MDNSRAIKPRDKMFCPACGSALQEHALLDPNLQGYACGNAHVCFVTLVEQAGGIPTVSTIDPPPIDDDVEVMKFWLTNPQARERLPNHLALVCRRIIEIVEGHRHVARLQQPFAFCPLCGDPLLRFDSAEVYLQGSRCRNGHEFWDRSGTAYYKEDGVRATLSTELDDEFLLQLIAYYAGDHEIIQPYVHQQMREALKRFVSGPSGNVLDR